MKPGDLVIIVDASISLKPKGSIGILLSKNLPFYNVKFFDGEIHMFFRNEIELVRNEPVSE